MADKKLNIKVRTQGAKKSKKALKGVEGGMKSLGKAAAIAGSAFFAARGLLTGFKKVIELSAKLEGVERGFKNLTKASWYNEDYDIFQTTKEEPLIRAMRNGLNDAGIDVEGSKGEASAAQEEMNVMYTEALEMADRHAIMKNGMKEI